MQLPIRTPHWIHKLPSRSKFETRSSRRECQNAKSGHRQLKIAIANNRMKAARGGARQLKGCLKLNLLQQCHPRVHPIAIRTPCTLRKPPNQRDRCGVKVKASDTNDFGMGGKALVLLLFYCHQRPSSWLECDRYSLMESAPGAILQLSAAYTFQLSLSFINMSAGVGVEEYGLWRSRGA